MGDQRKNIYRDLERDSGEFPVEDFVRAYAKAYFEADIQMLKKLRALLGEDYQDASHPDAGHSDSNVRSPLKPRPNMDSGAIALPMPQSEDSDR